jgi:hypothetical protein
VWIRCKVVKGREYYQVVESVRVRGKIRQRVVVALGQEPDLLKALRRMKSDLASLRWVAAATRSPRPERIAEHKRKARLQGRVAVLSNLLKKGSIPPVKTIGRRRR